MRAGVLRKRLTIQKRSDVIDASGGFQPVWVDVADVWGEIVPTGGKEELLDGAIRDSSIHQITVRYFAGLTPKNRLIYAGRIFNILNINNVEERNREMDITAQEGLNNG